MFIIKLDQIFNYSEATLLLIHKRITKIIIHIKVQLFIPQHANNFLKRGNLFFPNLSCTEMCKHNRA